MLADRHPEQRVPAVIGHLDSIEALRALAVTVVVLFHYRVARAPAAGDPWAAGVAQHPFADAALRSGYLGVDLFFLITGFLLVMPWARSAMQGAVAPDARDFYVRRIRRIVPAYYVQLVLLFALFQPLVESFDWMRVHVVFLSVNLVAHLGFAHYMTPVTSASLGLNGALWSLALEAQFYLLLPLLAPLFVRWPRATAAAMVAIAGLWRWGALHDLAPLVAFEMRIGARWNLGEDIIRHLLLTQLPGYLGHFALGMGMGCFVVRRRPDPGARTAWGWIAALVAGIAVLAWAYAGGGGALLGVFGAWLTTLAALGAVFMGVVRGGHAIERTLLRAPVLFVGRTSYSIYLYHLPMLMAWNHLRVLDGSGASLPAYLAVVLIAGWLSYRFVELPFLAR